MSLLYHPQNIKPGKYGYCFDVVKNGEVVGSLEMHAPGKHNIYNGLVSFAVCYDMGVSPSGIADALSKFTGAGRRFEFIGESKGITVVDDYAHHPTEMMATLQAAKTLDYKKVIVVFQPYTYSRVALLRDGMIEALSVADIEGLIIATRPDCMPDEILKYLQSVAKEKFIFIEYGAESTNNRVLERVNRCHTWQDTVDTVEKATDLVGNELFDRMGLLLINPRRIYNNYNYIYYNIYVEKMQVKVYKKISKKRHKKEVLSNNKSES